MDRRTSDSRGRWLLFALLAPLFALSATTCADASTLGFEDDDTSATPVAPDGALSCSGDGECSSGQSCLDGVCVASCLAAEALKGSIGCSFWATTPDIHTGEGSCFAAYIVNASREPISIEVEFAGQKIDKTGKVYLPRGHGRSLTYDALASDLAPNDVAVVFLDEFISGGEAHTRCPAGIDPLLTVDSAVHGTGRGAAFGITTSGPASAYTIFPYGGAPSFFPTATMLLPVASLGTDYIAIDAWERLAGQAAVRADPYVQVVATQDDTNVTITPVVDIHARGDVDGAAAGVPHTWTLARGEVLQLVEANELMGSPIVADKPIGVFGGSQAMNIPSDGFGYLDADLQQIPSVHAWGRELPAVSYRSRTKGTPESVPWRVVAAADGTELTYEPERPEDAPEVLDKGKSATFWTTSEFIVRSQDDEHPIYLSAHMTGGALFPLEMGDPEFVNVVPTGQFLTRYAFLTDPTYRETNLVLVRARAEGAFHDVVLDCAGTLEGWLPLGRDLEFVRADIMRDGIPQLYPNGTCGHGRHEIRSEGPFVVTVWGWDEAASYAFTGGSGTRTINRVVIR